jgi:hypothetical protein
MAMEAIFGHHPTGPDYHTTPLWGIVRTDWRNVATRITSDHGPRDLLISYRGINGIQYAVGVAT